MKYYPIENFKFNGIMESNHIDFKYMALLYNNEVRFIQFLYFGDKYDTHYCDTTGLNSYSHLDSNSIKDRMNFVGDNLGLLRKGYYNKTYFELKYLYDYDIDWFLSDENK